MDSLRKPLIGPVSSQRIIEANKSNKLCKITLKN